MPILALSNVTEPPSSETAALALTQASQRDEWLARRPSRSASLWPLWHDVIRITARHIHKIDFKYSIFNMNASDFQVTARAGQQVVASCLHHAHHAQHDGARGARSVMRAHPGKHSSAAILEAYASLGGSCKQILFDFYAPRSCRRSCTSC